MGKSVLVFISHSSEDKSGLIEPIVSDLENCYINVWIDKRNILPGDNLRKSIFKDGLDKADVALIFFTQNSLKSAWVDKEIKHVLREETKRGNNFNLSKIISIFDCKETYQEIAERYPELTDDLLHLMPENYSKLQLGQLISAIWSKYLQLQGGDIATQRQLLDKDKEILQKDKEVLTLRQKIESVKTSKSESASEFEGIFNSCKIDDFIKQRGTILSHMWINRSAVPNLPEAMAFGLLNNTQQQLVGISEKGKEFFKWMMINNFDK